MKSKILIVEDDTSLSSAYSFLFTKHGYEVLVAGNGEEANYVVDDFEPDLILLDLRMPKSGGIDFLVEYNKVTHKKTPKIIVFSNLDTKVEIQQAYDLGADRYVLKAWVAPRELLQLVQETLVGV